MSVLETFVRIRRHRARAAEFQYLAITSLRSDVRLRYLAAADHYAKLADAEVLSDQLRRRERLVALHAERQRQRTLARLARPRVAATDEAAPQVPETVKLRVIQGSGRKGARPSTARLSSVAVQPEWRRGSTR
jgi:hypothetical protein